MIKKGLKVISNYERRYTMNKKWFLMLMGTFLSVMLVGCNVDPDPEPAPPEVDAPADDQNDIPDVDENDTPGVDENDNMTKDDEEDSDPDPEDPIEDPKDIQDENNRDN
jgi:hypothetical protein